MKSISLDIVISSRRYRVPTASANTTSNTPDEDEESHNNRTHDDIVAILIPKLGVQEIVNAIEELRNISI